MVALLIGVSFAVAAPVPKDDAADKELRARAVKFLKDRHEKDGTWENPGLGDVAGLKGGTTALVALALLEAGAPANDPALAKAIAYLAELAPEKTYVVGLVTQVLARADAKKYAPAIQANADWLMANAVTRGDKLIGWSYPIAGGGTADNSNTHFALAGLHAATAAGAKVDPKLWGRVRDLYAREQTAGGGWGYVTDARPAPATASMTACGALALALAAKHDKPANPDPALAKALALLADGKLSGGKGTGYLLFTHAELGRALGGTEFRAGERARAWYREGAESVFKLQAENGSVAFDKNIGGNPVVGTAFALFALGPPAR